MQNKKTSESSKIFQMEFVPILRWMDYGGFEKKLKSLSKRTDEFLQALIDEQRHKEEEGSTMIDHMLSFALL
nr:cytochrome p450 81e8 [Quercus suber]